MTAAPTQTMSEAMTHADLLRQMRDGTLDACDFGHREHVGVAFLALEDHDFFDATALFARGIRRAADAAGASEKFNATVTFFFMSLIAERRAGSDYEDSEAFLAANDDLLSEDLLGRWYSGDRLADPLAKRIALLPDRAGPG